MDEQNSLLQSLTPQEISDTFVITSKNILEKGLPKSKESVLDHINNFDFTGKELFYIFFQEGFDKFFSNSSFEEIKDFIISTHKEYMNEYKENTSFFDRDLAFHYTHIMKMVVTGFELLFNNLEPKSLEKELFKSCQNTNFQLKSFF